MKQAVESMEFWGNKERYLPCFLTGKSRGPVVGAKAEDNFGCCTHGNFHYLEEYACMGASNERAGKWPSVGCLKLFAHVLFWSLIVYVSSGDWTVAFLELATILHRFPILTVGFVSSEGLWFLLAQTCLTVWLAKIWRLASFFANATGRQLLRH